MKILKVAGVCALLCTLIAPASAMERHPGEGDGEGGGAGGRQASLMVNQGAALGDPSADAIDVMLIDPESDTMMRGTLVGDKARAFRNKIATNPDPDEASLFVQQLIQDAQRNAGDEAVDANAAVNEGDIKRNAQEQE